MRVATAQAARRRTTHLGLSAQLSGGRLKLVSQVSLSSSNKRTHNGGSLHTRCECDLGKQMLCALCALNKQKTEWEVFK